MALNKIEPEDIRINTIIGLSKSEYKIVGIVGDRVKVLCTRDNGVYTVGIRFILQDMYLVKRGSVIEYKKNKE